MGDYDLSTRFVVADDAKLLAFDVDVDLAGVDVAFDFDVSAGSFHVDDFFFPFATGKRAGTEASATGGE